jgi:hypothetical protein
MNLLGSSSSKSKYDSEVLNNLRRTLGASYEKVEHGSGVRQNGIDLFIPYVKTDLDQVDVGEEHRYVGSAQRGVILSSEQAKKLIDESGLKENKEESDKKPADKKKKDKKKRKGGGKGK